MRTGRLRRLIAVQLGIVALLVASATGAGAVGVSVVPRPAPQALIDLIDSSVEANIGQEISTISNDNPTTWPAEDPDVVLAPTEQLQYLLYAYDFSYPTVDCASYVVDISMAATANGPDTFPTDSMVMGFMDPNGAVIAGGSFIAPATVGASTDLALVGPVPPELIRGGLTLGYGAINSVRAGPDLQIGYTFGAPAIELSEDLSQCDLDGDGISDDIDPDNTNSCVPDPTSAPCLASSPATPAPPATPGVTPIAAAASSPVAPNLPTELAATGVALGTFATVGAGAVLFGVLALVAHRMVLTRAPRSSAAARPRGASTATSRSRLSRSARLLR